MVSEMACVPEVWDPWVRVINKPSRGSFLWQWEESSVTKTHSQGVNMQTPYKTTIITAVPDIRPVVP